MLVEFYGEMPSKEANRTANIVDPDQTAPFMSILIWVCTVFPVQNHKIIKTSSMKYNCVVSLESLSFGFLTRSNTKQAIWQQKMARGWNFKIYEVVGLHTILVCSKNKGAYS